MTNKTLKKYIKKNPLTTDPLCIVLKAKQVKLY